MSNSYLLEFSDEAIEDSRISVEWYEEQQINLGRAFLDAINHRISFLLQNPKAAPIVFDNFRKIRVNNTFPFIIIYEVVEKRVIISAVFHTSRNPKSWKNR
jgi:plasmid stabilization system protein ParE